MDLSKSYTTRLVGLVLKIWPTGLVPLRRLGLGIGVAETCRVKGLDTSVSEMRGNHTDLAEPD